MENVGLITAFVFGVLSFISPCVLPIVPGYISYISGVSFEEIQSSENRSRVRMKVLLNGLMFVAGFSLVFVALGASATFVGQFLRENLNILGKIAGAVIIIFGLHMIGVFKIPFLNYEKRIQAEKGGLGLIGAFVVGLAFAFGWTPCIGPILAAILAVASQQETIGQGIALLVAYSLGLGVPFIITGLSITAFYSFFNRFKRHLHTVEVVGGIMLVLVGILIMTNYLTVISGYLSRWFPILQEIG